MANHEETIQAAGADTNPVVTGNISGGTNQTYVVAVANKDSINVTNVSGGSLSWTERVAQCGGRDQGRVEIWTAFGSPSSAFTITVTFASTPGVANGSSVIVSRYSGVDTTTQFEDFVGQNTNGENGVCSGGTDTDNPQLTTGSTMADSVHYVATYTRNRTITTPDSDYTQRAFESTYGSDMYVHDYKKAATGDDLFSATMSATQDWATAGLVIKSAIEITVDKWHPRFIDRYEQKKSVIPY